MLWWFIYFFQFWIEEAGWSFYHVLITSSIILDARRRPCKQSWLRILPLLFIPYSGLKKGFFNFLSLPNETLLLHVMLRKMLEIICTLTLLDQNVPVSCIALNLQTSWQNIYATKKRRPIYYVLVLKKAKIGSEILRLVVF